MLKLTRLEAEATLECNLRQDVFGLPGGSGMRINNAGVHDIIDAEGSI